MNTVIRCATLSLLIAGTGFHGFASAQTPDPDDAMRIDFESTDSNNDGYITREELPMDHALLIRFESLDRNGDERLSPDELDDYL